MLTMNTTGKTCFAPAERTKAADLERQCAAIEADQGLKKILDAMPDLVMVLNTDRQIIYGNAALSAFADAQGCSTYIGIRAGELLCCRYALAAECGCGTAEECRECGAIQAILATLEGGKSNAECRILAETPTGPEAIDLRVWGTPFEWNSEQFALMVAGDISHEKRRNVLERIFFHDILNTAGAINSMTDMLLSGMISFEEAKEDLHLTARTLLSEICTQRDLLAAEKNELAVRIVPVQTREILESVTAQYRNQPAEPARGLIIEKDSENTALTTDPALLVRVLGNLVKNAIEAESSPGEIRVSCRCEGTDRVAFTCSNPSFIPPSQQAHIFHRSFSTKGAGRGIGTYSVKLLTEKYLKGSVRFTSSPESGTRFTVSLPRSLDPS